MLNWSRYLESLCNAYAQWWRVYTITDVVRQKRVEAEPLPLLFDFGLMVQTVERDREQRAKGEETVERLSVLEGLRKYASEHVLLVGRPGSGKSTALVRLLLEEAQKNLTPPAPLPCKGRGEQDFSLMDSPLLAGEGLGERSSKGHGNQPKIPVLVELRYYRTSILDLIQDFLQRHEPNLTVDAETLKTWLRQGQLLLLVDGLNELPSEEARRDLHKLRQDYQKTTPMIFTTRDLGVGGDLDIAKKLEMQPLNEAQMQQFVRAYLPEQGEQMLRQLGSRLREFGQTPLLLWMLCSLFRAMGKVPPNLGKVFRQFALSYYGKLKQDVPVTEESREWCQLLLEQLAFSMTQGKNRIDLQVAIPKQEAEEILTAFLRHEGLDQPRNRALKWLKDLLKHHLIQLGAGDQIEFRHQLIQEYYTAEYLLKVLTPQGRTSPPAPLLRGEGSKIVPVPPFPRREGGLGGLGLSDDELKRDYLNYLKWTEPLALMLELVEDEAQAVRVVKLALEVDLRLGARLAGAVKPKFQEKTIDLVTILEISQQLKMLLLGITRSHIAIDILSQALEHRDSSVRWFTTEALGQIVSEATIPGLKRAIQDEDNWVRWAAFKALEKIGTEAIIPALSQATKDENPMICEQAIYLLGDIAREAAIPYLIEALAKEDNSVRGSALCILGQICGKDTIPELIQDLEDRGFDVHSGAFSVIRLWHGIAFFPRRSIAYGRVGYNNTISCYAKRMCQRDTIPVLCQKLGDEDPNVRKTAVYMLGKIGTDQAIHALCQALDNKDSIVRRDAVHWLGQGRRETGTKTVFPCLLQALEDEDSDVCGYASYVLEQIGIPELLPNLFEMELTAANNIYGILETISVI